MKRRPCAAVAALGAAAILTVTGCANTSNSTAGSPTAPPPTQTGTVAASAQPPTGIAARAVYLYFGSIYVSNPANNPSKATLSGVSGTIRMSPQEGTPNAGTFTLNQGFTMGLSMEWAWSATGTYSYSPTADIYEFQIGPESSAFGGGTLTAANGTLIGTLTQDGDIGTTFSVPYTTQ